MTIQDIDEPVDFEIKMTSKTTTRDALMATRTEPVRDRGRTTPSVG